MEFPVGYRGERYRLNLDKQKQVKIKQVNVLQKSRSIYPVSFGKVFSRMM